MKAGILTFYYKNDNFGGQLQARALVRAIEEYSTWEAEQIQYDYLRSWNKKPYYMRFFKSIGQAFQNGPENGFTFLLNRFKAEKSINSNSELSKTLQNKLNERKQAFLKFSEDTPHSKAVYDNDSIKECLEQYDCFICGGDQIWNDWSDWFVYNALNNFCLTFVPEKIQKFSYAPSVPLKTIRPFFIDRLTKNIQSLDAISVREKSSLTFLQNNGQKNIITVIDPVLLLSQQQWDKELKETNIKGDYVFCYLLGEGIDNRVAVENYANSINCKLVTEPHIINVNDEDKDFGDVQDFSSGPAEFISLIKNAKVVVTDSFHAAVFSMIYHKPFYVLERTTKVSGGSMGSRLTDFLNEYKLEKQNISYTNLYSLNEIPKIDFIKADYIWNQRRIESFKYLKENLVKKGER